ncbi:carbon-nitrogen hydrolase family protein [Acidiphilium sp. PA]|uniref:carbon-nitrogen hydrolase family protein n=1 Tax=Acidiphilium sp. PA TaxID=2871705 RepID=UPI0022447769|nr:carbon-nitrogen hydrolase family protein [Acidiphilium sp. PA]MCW8306214.1 carbon-nitrogen hydrolase family protein [Acidiphilium sp. PA]
MTLTIAICQTEGCFADPDAAISLLDATARAASQRGAALLVLPELFCTGYNLGADRARSLAMSREDARFTKIRAIARAHGIALCLGFPEIAAGGVANSAALIDAAGEILLTYRKIHLFGALDRAMFAVRGGGFPVVAWRGFTVGLAICYDIEFPETARALALAGADLILVPTALMPPYDVVADHVIPARAYENQVFIAYANHCGSEDGLAYIGKSSICGPDGAILAKAAAGPELILAMLDPAHQARVRARDALLADRRPEFYRSLTA